MKDLVVIRSYETAYVLYRDKEVKIDSYDWMKI